MPITSVYACNVLDQRVADLRGLYNETEFSEWNKDPIKPTSATIAILSDDDASDRRSTSFSETGSDRAAAAASSLDNRGRGKAEGLGKVEGR